LQIGSSLLIIILSLILCMAIIEIQLSSGIQLECDGFAACFRGNVTKIVDGDTLDVNGIITATGGNSSNWNTAFSWGNHAAAGYLTSFTETDPQVGTNTSSFAPRWNGSALVTGIIYDNATSIGIGTTTVADSKFSVEQTGTSVATTKFVNIFIH